MDQVDEIKQKLDIAGVVGEYVPLKKVGRNLKARCPFHHEKTPSFYVSPDRQIWHCFGCNEGGDMFTFVQKIEGIEFPEALRILAQKAGVELKHYDPRVASQKNRLFDICAGAADFWHQRLSQNQNREAGAYIEKRKIKPATIAEFKIGFAPDSWDETMKFLLVKGFSESEIFQAGLTVKKEKGSGYYDRFRGRLIFPIRDIHGNIIGFSGRTLKADEAAKYINTPESPIYHKGGVLFCLDKARQAIREQGYAIIVEGNMDALTCHEAGFKNVVACSGTALTMDQIRLLKRYTENVVLCFDQDAAGQAAAEKSIDLLFDEEMNVKIIELKYGKDPDECVKHDVQVWIDSIKTSKAVMQFYFDKYFTADALKDPHKKKQAAKIVFSRLEKIKDKIERDFWIKRAAEILAVDEGIIREALAASDKLKQKPGKNLKEPEKKTAESRGLEEQCFEKILAILLNFPRLISFAIESLPPDYVLNEKQKLFYKDLILFYNNETGVSPEKINQWLKNGSFQFEKSYLDSLILLIEKFYEGFSAEEINNELVGLIKVVKIHYLDEKIKSLSQSLARAEQEGEKEAETQYATEIMNLEEQRARLK
ncbi:DNA primase [Candidatus Falkowbacteria bacterium]|nr:DNA primase [Candidatus Falkowbacteria bacterium]